MLDLFLLVWNWLELHTRWVDELGGDKSDTITIDHTQTPTMNEVISSNPLEWEEPVTPAPVTPTVPTAQNPDVLVDDWSKPQNAYHNTRVLCDLSGLTVEQKNTICECIYQESRFNNAAVCRNRNSQGIITSSDWGICQINDYFNIGAGNPFPTVDYVVENPQAAVQFMIDEYKKGNLKLWVSYSSGVYKQWGLANSPMWKLATVL